MSLLDFGYRGTLAEDDPFMLALQMQQMQGGDPRQGFASQAPYERPNPLMGTVATPEVTNVAAPVASQPETPQPDPLAEYRSVMSREPGFFQENAPLILGLLGGISGLLEATGPSRVPISGGQVFARGLQSGLGGYMGYKGLKKAGDSFNNMLNNLRNNSKLGGNKRVDDVRKNSGDPNVGQKYNFGNQGNKP